MRTWEAIRHVARIERAISTIFCWSSEWRMCLGRKDASTHNSIWFSLEETCCMLLEFEKTSIIYSIRNVHEWQKYKWMNILSRYHSISHLFILWLSNINVRNKCVWSKCCNEMWFRPIERHTGSVARPSPPEPEFPEFRSSRCSVWVMNSFSKISVSHRGKSQHSDQTRSLWNAAWKDIRSLLMFPKGPSKWLLLPIGPKGQ